MKRPKVILVEQDERGANWVRLIVEGQRKKINLSAEHVAETLLVEMRKWAAETMTAVTPVAEGPKKKLEELEVGDKVIASSYHVKRIATIERVTKTQLVVGKSRFNRKSGYLCGDHSWDSTSLKVATQQDVVEITRQRNVEHLCNLKPETLKHLSDDEINCILDILKP